MESESFVRSFSSIFVRKLEYYLLIVLNLGNILIDYFYFLNLEYDFFVIFILSSSTSDV